MSFIIPPELLKSVNRYSGYINANSPYAKKNMKGLFLLPINREYLANTILSYLTNKDYVESVILHPNLSERYVNGINKNKSTFKRYLMELVGEYSNNLMLPYKEELSVNNPVQQLSIVNKKFLKATVKNMIDNPDSLMPDFYDYNMETGANESNIEYDYTTSSYASGYWKPEDLFINCQANKHIGQWEPLHVDWQSSGDATGLGHRYNSSVYTSNSLNRSQFSPYGIAITSQMVDRNDSEGLREGGLSDRRTNFNRGFDMSRLQKRSTF